MELLMNDELLNISLMDVTSEEGTPMFTTNSTDDFLEDVMQETFDEYLKYYQKDLYDPYKDELYGLSMIYDPKQLIWKAGYINYMQYLLYAENKNLREALEELDKQREDYIERNQLNL